MTALDLLAEIRARGVRVQVDAGRLIVEGDISRELTSEIGRRESELIRLLRPSVPPGSVRADRSKPIPLSVAQRRLWFLTQMLPPTGIYNLTTAHRLHTRIDAALVERAVNQIVARHEALRTAFVLSGDAPVQECHDDVFVPLRVVDLRGMSAADAEAESRRLASADAALPFDLARPPLLRTSLMLLDDEASVFLITIHHIVCDGWSQKLFFDELGHRYSCLQSGAEPELPGLPVQYADYAAWQERHIASGALDDGIQYWRRHLGGIQPLDFPADRPRPRVPSFRGSRLYLNFSADLTSRLTAIAESHGATLFITLLTAFHVLLARYCGGEERVAVGTPVAGRVDPVFEPLIGFFVNMIVLTADLSGNPTFAEFLERQRATALAAYSHQDVPFDILVQVLQPERDLSRNPLFQICFQLAQFRNDGAAAPAVTDVVPQFELSTSPFDLSVTLWPDAGRIGGSVQFATDLFDSGTIRRLIADYEVLLDSACAEPHRCVWDLPMTRAPEARSVSAAFAPDLCVRDLWNEQAERTPDLFAVIAGDRSLTYRELRDEARRLAKRLQEAGAAPGVLVGCCLERSSRMAVGLRAILESGATYVPLDPAYPRERLAYMIEDSELKLILTERALENPVRRAAGDSPFILFLDDALENGESFMAAASADGLAYVMYTSGSTGRPKGVMVGNRGLVNVAERQREIFSLGPGDRVLQFASPSFDACVFEFLLAWSSGAALCIPTRIEALPGPQLVRLLRKWRITCLTIPPTALACLPEEECAGLRMIHVAGEVCPAELAAKWARGRRFFNLYGPTEASIWATAEEYEGGADLCIGRPIGNVRAYVVDRRGRETPAGVSGELWLGGAGIAHGYWRMPELTAERFIDDPFEPGGLVYRTGDKVRRRSDERLQFLGRMEAGQVKVRGQRIELGEVEAAIASHPEVANCAAAVKSETLVAYIVPRARVNGTERLTLEVRDHARRLLPEGFVPARVCALTTLPMTANGKLDRNALPDIEITRSAGSGFVAPRTPTEKVVAAVYREVLRLDRVGAEDGFFDLGGHSLLVVAAQIRLQSALRREVPIVEFFRNRTVADMGAWLDGGTGMDIVNAARVRASRQLAARQQGHG